jgi:hypothetical protein
VSATSYAELGELVAAQLTAAQRLVLDHARGFANESGIVAARNALREAVESIDKRQDAVRAAQDAERAAREAVGDAQTEVEWEMRDARVVKEGNKTYWVTDDDETEMVVKQIAGEGTEFASQAPTGRKRRIQVTADEARDRLAREVKKHAAVVEAETSLRKAEESTYAARDAAASAERRFSAARADLTAAGIYLQTFALALPRPEENR